MTGSEIERKSFAILESKFVDMPFPEPDRQVALRVAHATADIEFARTLVISPGAVEAGITAIRAGGNIITDVAMVKAGIRSASITSFGGSVRTFLYDEGIAEEASREGTTKSVIAMRRAVPYMEGGIVAIGNAPTALFELIELIERGLAKPALVVATPVGFVGAADSKLKCESLGVPFITNRGDRGGSPVAAAAVNAIIRLASER